MNSRTAGRVRVAGKLLGGLVWMAFVVAPSFAPAQDERTPLQVGNYNVSGVVSVGNRFVDVSGNRAKYNELLNLHDGFRVLDAHLDFLSREPNQGWFDRFSVSTQSLGGDPFPLLRLDLRKNGLYELRAGYRAAQYFYDLPQTDLTPNRGWIDRRRFADAELRYTPTRNWRFRFFYNRTEREGSDLSTGPFFYLPQGRDMWSAFGRPDRVSWVIPLREEANLYGGSIDYRFGKTNLHVEQSYRTYNNPANLRRFPNQPVELLGPTSPQQNLIVSRWDAFSSFNIPTTSIRVDQEVGGRLQLRAGYLYSHASGPASLTGTVGSPAVTIGGTQLPAFSVNYTGAGTTNLTTHTTDAGFTLKILESLDLVSDYRYQILTQKGTQTINATRSDFPVPVLITRDESLRWDFGMHTLDTVLAFVPHQTLSVRAGLRFFKEDIVRKTNGRTAPGTERSWYYTPVINVSWKPSQAFSLRGQFEQRTTVDPYVRILPEGTVGATLRARFSPNDRWGIDNVFSFRNWETESLGLLMHSRTNSTNLWYQPYTRLGLQAGFNYGSFFSDNSIAYLRGTPPLRGLLSTSRTIDRNYFWGIKTSPVGGLTLSYSGQFLRSTGLATFSGETSFYGPLTWPAWNAEIAYSFPKVGRLVFGWQRSYYKEDLFRATDYSANGFMMRFDLPF